MGGFIILDIAYSAVVINYAIQCQLLVYLLWSIGERIKAKEWDIDQSVKVSLFFGNTFLIVLLFFIRKFTMDESF